MTKCTCCTYNDPDDLPGCPACGTVHASAEVQAATAADAKAEKARQNLAGAETALATATENHGNAKATVAETEKAATEAAQAVKDAEAKTPEPAPEVSTRRITGGPAPEEAPADEPKEAQADGEEPAAPPHEDGAPEGSPMAL